PGEEEQLANPWRDDRDDHEYSHGHGHDLRHASALAQIAHHGDGDNARGGRADALQRARGKEEFETRRDDAEDRTGGEEAQRPEQYAAPAERVGERAVDKLGHSE